MGEPLFKYVNHTDQSVSKEVISLSPSDQQKNGAVSCLSMVLFLEYMKNLKK